MSVLAAGSLYCHACGGDMMDGTCTCEHEKCPACVGCVTCGIHEKQCEENK